MTTGSITILTFFNVFYMTMTGLSLLCIQTHLVLLPTLWGRSYDFIDEKLSHREIKLLDQGHTVDKGWKWNVNPAIWMKPESLLITPSLYHLLPQVQSSKLLAQRPDHPPNQAWKTWLRPHNFHVPWKPQETRWKLERGKWLFFQIYNHIIYTTKKNELKKDQTIRLRQLFTKLM